MCRQAFLDAALHSTEQQRYNTAGPVGAGRSTVHSRDDRSPTTHEHSIVLPRRQAPGFGRQRSEGHSMSATPSVATIFEAMRYGPAPESPVPARDWLAAHAPRLSLFINGEWRAPGASNYFPSINPATTQPLIEVALGTTEDVHAAVSAARA